MELNWLQSLVYGLISGLAEFLPVSADAHRALFLKLTGTEEGAAIKLAVHLGCLLALIFACHPALARMRRERRLAAMPPKRRKRQPDRRSILDIRVLNLAMIPMMLCFLLYSKAAILYQRLWITSLFMIVNGLLLYVPQFLPGSNKDSQSLSPLDSVVIGLGGGIGSIPGLSRVGAVNAVAQVRGTEKRYALELSLLLSIPALLALLILDGTALAGAVPTLTALSVICWILAGAAAFGGAWLAIFILRFLVFNTGFSGFSYYCWGFALLTFFLYLI